MHLKLTITLAAVLLLAGIAASDEPVTCFQTNSTYRDDLNIRSDAVISYVAGWGMETVDLDRINTWKGKGYDIWAMFSISHGGRYANFGGVDHPDIVQKDRNGSDILIGGGCSYVVPTMEWVDFCTKLALDSMAAGANAICPEEPEFWVRGGYSDAFKREWKDYYGSDWTDPAASPDAYYRSSRLKSYLYARAYDRLFAKVKAKSSTTLCLVPTHSNPNYAAWGIIFPHAQVFRNKNVDGMIGQVWTGTSRTPIMYAGKNESRVFPNAFLEYDYFANLARRTDKSMLFLFDPIEDDPNYTWSEYRMWFEQTFTAALMFPDVNEYEVTPWPERVVGRDARDRAGKGGPIPQSYATELLTLWTTLRQMPNAPPHACRRIAGTEGVGVVTSDTYVWQRGGPSECTMDSFYGLALPLLTNGIPVEVVPLERAGDHDYMADMRVLLLSYDAMKPPTGTQNMSLAQWVKGGGTLIVFGGEDAYNDIDSWWRRAGYASPTDHLLLKLGVAKKTRPQAVDVGAAIDFMGPPAGRLSVAPHTLGRAVTACVHDAKPVRVLASSGDIPMITMQTVGKGKVMTVALPSAYFASSQEAADLLVNIARRAIVATPERAGTAKPMMRYLESSGITVRRGKFVIARALNAPLDVTGRYLDLLDPLLPYEKDPSLAVGLGAFLYDLDLVAEKKTPRVLLTSGHIDKQSESGDETTLTLSGPSDRIGAIRIYAPKQLPSSIEADGAVESSWDSQSRTLLLLHPLSPAGKKITVRWANTMGDLPPMGSMYEELTSKNPRPLVAAHRGASAVAPENTLAAIRKAIALGTNLIEIDVRRTKDDQIVLLHDDTIDRTTNNKGKLCDLTLVQVRALDAGSWKGSEFAEEGIPTLDEALAAVKGNAKLLIEIKDDGIESLVADAVMRAGEDTALIQSFSYDGVAKVKTLLPNTECGWLIGALPDGQGWDQVIDRANAAGLSFLACDQKLIDRSLIDKAYAKGLKILAYTVDDEITMQRLIDLGTSGIITNVPDIALQAAARQRTN